MSIYYVATFNHYVLVDADNEQAARELATPLITELNPTLYQKFGVRILTVRLATADEIEFMRGDWTQA